VRWEVDAILTDVTQTWLELRNALRGRVLCFFFDFFLFISEMIIGDYDKIGSQYGRGFLWTTLWFYTPFVLARGQQAKWYLEKIAGPFDETTA
jgi:phosphatidylglycerol phospholipase C